MNDKCPQCGYHLSDFLKTQLTAQLDEEYLARETKKLAEFSTRFEEKEAWQKEIVDQLHEKDNEILHLKTIIKDLEIKAAQGSQQAQGEVGEILIEETLRRNFRFDTVSEVKKDKMVPTYLYS